MPARTEYLQLLRLNVAGLAASAFDIDEVEDLKIAIEELAALLIGCDGADQLDVRFRLDEQAFAVDGRRRVEPDTELELDEFLPTVLEAVVDEFRVAQHDGDATFRFEKRVRGR